MIDAQKTTQAELSLACLNCTIQLSALKGFRCNPILRELAAAIRSEIEERCGQLCEMSITLAPDVDVDGVATLTLLPGQTDFQFGPELDEPVERGHLSVKIRALAKPDHLHAAVTLALTHTWTVFPNIFARLAEMEHFAAPKSGSSPSFAVR